MRRRLSKLTFKTCLRTLISKRFAHVPYSKVTSSPSVNFISSSTAINLNENKQIISIKQLIDKKAKYVQCSGPKKSWDLEDIKYDRLIIATGLRPRKIHPNGLTVYDANDVEKFDFKGKNVCVIGGSFLAIETATNLGKNAYDLI